MHKDYSDILIFLGKNYTTQLLQMEQCLPFFLSHYKKVVCFEYPQYKKLFSILTKKIQLIEKRSDRLIIYHSFALFPFGKTLIFINFLNHFLNFLIFKLTLKNINFKKLIIISFTPETVFLLSFIKNQSIYYHVLEENTALPWWKNTLSKKQYIFLEKQILKVAQKIIVVSKTLYQKYKQYNTKVYLFPSPANIKLLEKCRVRSNYLPRDMLHVPKPIVGFMGSIYDWKLDINLLDGIIKKYINCSFVFIGLIGEDSINFRHLLTDNNNCYFLGYKHFSDLLYYLLQFDVCLIPYKTDSYGLSAYPVKIMEYLAMGKPVVTTALPSIKYLSDKNLIYWSRNSSEFIKNIELALKEKYDQALLKRRIKEAKKNDWNIRIKEFIKIIEEKNHE